MWQEEKTESEYVTNVFTYSDVILDVLWIRCTATCRNSLVFRPSDNEEPFTLTNDNHYDDLYFAVPSRAPSKVRAASHGFNELLVEWDPLPHQYANGRLLGYKVYYKDTDYYYWSEKSVNTSNADESQVVLGGVQTGRRYKIAVIAFTSKGEGPRSPDLYVTKGKDQLNTEILPADSRVSSTLETQNMIDKNSVLLWALKTHYLPTIPLFQSFFWISSYRY